MPIDLDDLPEIKPGDLITSDLINTLVREMKNLVAGVGNNPVPNLFGRTISDVKNTLAQGGNKLKIAGALDAAGVSVDIGRAENAGRLVVGQIPPPDARVADNTNVFLLIAAVAGSGPQQSEPPVITGFSPLTAPVGTPVQIIGKEFDPVQSRNKVTFDGVTAATPSSDSTRFSLFVTVPTGIPGAPTTTGQQKVVSVVVTTATGIATAQLVITPPPAQPTPSVSSFSPAIGAKLGSTLTITGQNFGSVPSNVRVFFDDQPLGGSPPAPVGVQPATATGTQLTVVIPANLDGFGVTGDRKTVSIKVSVGPMTSLGMGVILEK
ncbi:IPT/TIG domain-containing protein [Pyxidicoccus trucidator]|uniref:IPT/TIG domain-containing protein n=1 Tax=Pyxidicoccus trucidator TaxID=2709662 RepID=UPI0013DC7792|nr:IPT/TIG domain-containing protein [Pyxidicoccus trucidator]